MNPQDAIIGSSLAGLSGTPPVEMPKVGDTIMLRFQHGSVFQVRENMPVYGEGEYVEVEVKAIRKAQISFV